MRRSRTPRSRFAATPEGEAEAARWRQILDGLREYIRSLATRPARPFNYGSIKIDQWVLTVLRSKEPPSVAPGFVPDPRFADVHAECDRRYREAYESRQRGEWAPAAPGTPTVLPAERPTPAAAPDPAADQAARIRELEEAVLLLAREVQKLKRRRAKGVA